jgi:drug/metabolite transporter (DMT)-like permease
MEMKLNDQSNSQYNADRGSALHAQGIVGSGIGFTLMSWCIQVRGPLYVSMFSPLLLVVVAIIGWAILGEKIRVGTYVDHQLTSQSVHGEILIKLMSSSSAPSILHTLPAYSAVGSVLIVAGLYMVLWGKGREMDRPDLDNDDDIADEETAVGLVGFSGKGGGAVAIASSRVEAISLPVSFSTTSPKRLQHIHG